MIYNGMQIIFTPHALMDTDVRNFPASRHRSNRILKKLLKRYGTVYVQEPCAYSDGKVIFAHPAWKSEIARHVSNSFN